MTEPPSQTSTRTSAPAVPTELCDRVLVVMSKVPEARNAVDAELSQGLDAALDFAEVIAANALLTRQASKRVVSARYGGADGAPPRDLPREHDAWRADAQEIVALMSTEDVIEGPTAFVEKRTPVWKAK